MKELPDHDKGCAYYVSNYGIFEQCDCGLEEKINNMLFDEIEKLEKFIKDILQNWAVYPSEVWLLVNKRGYESREEKGWMKLSRFNELLDKHNINPSEYGE